MLLNIPAVNKQMLLVTIDATSLESIKKAVPCCKVDLCTKFGRAATIVSVLPKVASAAEKK